MVYIICTEGRSQCNSDILNDLNPHIEQLKAGHFLLQSMGRHYSGLMVSSGPGLRSWLTCDQAFFFRRNVKVSQRESRQSKREKKERLIQLLHESSAAPCLLCCRQSCCGPLRKQTQYFREVSRSCSWFVIGGFRSILLVSTFG